MPESNTNPPDELDDLPPMGRLSLDDFPDEASSSDVDGGAEGDADVSAALEALPAMGRVSLEDFMDETDRETVASEPPRVNADAARPASEASGTVSSGMPATGGLGLPNNPKNRRIPDEEKPPGTRAQKIRTVILTLLVLALLMLFWPVGPTSDALMARFPADYRLRAETRALHAMLREFDGLNVEDRFWDAPLGRLIAEEDTPGTPSTDSPPSDLPNAATSATPDGVSNEALDEAGSRRERARAALESFRRQLNGPGGSGLLGAALNGSVAWAATGPDLDDQVFAAHSLRAARALFAWRHWRGAEDHPEAGRVLRVSWAGRDYWCRAVHGLIVGVTKPSRMAEVVASLTVDPKKTPPPAWAINAPAPAVLFRWSAPASFDASATVDKSVPPAPRGGSGPAATGTTASDGAMGASLLPGDFVEAGALSASVDAPVGEASADASCWNEVGAVLRVLDKRSLAWGQDAWLGMVLFDGKGLRLVGTGEFRAPGFTFAERVADAAVPHETFFRARPPFADRDAADDGDARAAAIALFRPEFRPPLTSESQPHLALAGRLPMRAAWRQLGEALFGASGRPLRGGASTEALLAWESVEDGLVAGLDGRFAFALTPPPLEIRGEQAVPLMPEVHGSLGLVAPRQVEERLNEHRIHLASLFTFDDGDADAQTLRETVHFETIGAERHTVTRLHAPPLLVNYAEPAWTVLKNLPVPGSPPSALSSSPPDRLGDPGSLWVFSSHAPRLTQPRAVPYAEGVEQTVKWLDVSWSGNVDEAFARTLRDVAHEKIVLQADAEPSVMRAREEMLRWAEAALRTLSSGWGRVSIPYADERGVVEWRAQAALYLPEPPAAP